MIARMLDLSTAHITEETDEWLDEAVTYETYPIIAYQKGDYGWIVHVPDEWDEEAVKDIPADLLALLVFAKARRCHWIMLDRDAFAVDELPQYEW